MTTDASGGAETIPTNSGLSGYNCYLVQICYEITISNTTGNINLTLTII